MKEDFVKRYNIYVKYQPNREKTFKDGYETVKLHGNIEFIRGLYVASVVLQVKYGINSIHRFMVIEEQTAHDIGLNSKSVYTSQEMGSTASLLDLVDTEDYFIVREKRQRAKQATTNPKTYTYEIIVGDNYHYQCQYIKTFLRGYRKFMSLLNFPIDVEIDEYINGNKKDKVVYLNNDV